MDTNSPLVNWPRDTMELEERSILDFVEFIAENDINVIPVRTPTTEEITTPVEESQENEPENEPENESLNMDIVRENSIITHVNRLDRVFHEITNTSHLSPSQRQDHIPNIIWNPDQWWINFIRANTNHQ